MAASGSAESTPKTLTRFDLPGFTLPLNYNPKKAGVPQEDQPFKTALDIEDINDGYVGMRLMPLREFTMMRIMNDITDKRGWDTKVFDDNITSKWRKEALESGQDVTLKMMDWVIDELKYKATIFQETGAVSVYDGDVVKSDVAIPDWLKKALQKAVLPLEDVPEDQKDYHPGSDDKVVDLVHPSLFPLMYGRSRILRDEMINVRNCLARSGNGEVIPVPPKDQTMLDMVNQYWNQRGQEVPPFSQKFQWLPCDVGFGDDDDCYIASYINNLHPERHRELYDVIQQIIVRAIPLWNMTLTPLKARYVKWRRIEYEGSEYLETTIPEPSPGPGEDRDDEAFQTRIEKWWQDRVRLPEPGDFKPPSTYPHMKDQCFEQDGVTLRKEMHVDLRREYREKGLQIIVKLANIELTPEKPDYGGGSWHIEGQMNEHICATALYYPSNHNITPSTLSFRQGAETDDIDIGYEQDDHKWLLPVFGCTPDDPGVQALGSVSCLENRLLTFPNILQHRVSPFSLLDRSKPGHRKILALFLVDPHIRIVSTANVPPQRKDWWDENLDLRSKVLSELPAELQDMVIEEVGDFPLTMGDARGLRLELMEERKKVGRAQEKDFESREFSLCEH